MSFKTMTAKEVYDLSQTGRPIDLIDVRSAGEFASVHAAGARNIPLNTITREAVLSNRLAPAGDPIYIICQSGGRSRTACTRLIADGLENVVNVEGGTSAWKSAGLPVESAPGSAKPAWIRPAGILLVFGCLALGVTVSQYFAIAAAVVWLGLMVTGNGPCCCSAGSCSVPKGQ
ncbi:MAG: rhodanese-like domain-containing protein [Tepidisphaerales bacterium]